MTPLPRAVLLLLLLALATAAAPQDGARTTLKELCAAMKEHRREGRPDEALAELERVPKEVRNNPRVTVEHLAALLDARRTQEARQLAARIELPESGVEGLPVALTVSLARVAWLRGEGDEARRLAATARAGQADQVDLRVLDLTIALAAERFDEAGTLLAGLQQEVGARRLADLRADVALARAERLVPDAGLRGRAIELLGAARQEAPWRGDLAALEATALLAEGRLDDAAARLGSVAADVSPVDRDDLLAADAALRCARGEHAEARAAWQRVLESRPHHGRGELDFARCLVHDGQHDAGLAKLREAVERRRDALDARVALAEVLAADGDLQAAEAELLRAREESPDSVLVLQRLVELSARDGGEPDAELVARLAERRQVLAALVEG